MMGNKMILDRRHLLLLAGGAATVLISGRLPRASAAETIRIGAIHPYSGPMANYGDESAKGYELAIDKVNAAGGVLGKRVELIRGDAANAQQGIAAVEQLADQVDLFTGTYTSAVSNAASDAAAQHNKIYWDTEALAQNLTERGLPNFIRSGPDASTFGRGTVETVIKLVVPELKKDPTGVKVWIEHETSIYGTSIADTQEALFKEAGIQVVGRGSHAYDAIDVNDSILRAKNAQPAIWIQTGYVEDGNLLLRTAAEQGFKPPVTVMTGVGSSPETLEAIGAEALEGILVVAYPRTDTRESFAPGVSEFLAAYKKKFNRDPLAPESLTCYAGMQMLLETIEAAGDTSVEKIREAAAKMDKPISSYANGFGLKLDEKFQNTRALTTTVQWQSGNPVTVYPLEAAPEGTKLVPFSKA
jgi:branched-chain amino acid transport system substrate-binding protein